MSDVYQDPGAEDHGSALQEEKKMDVDEDKPTPNTPSSSDEHRWPELISRDDAEVQSISRSSQSQKKPLPNSIAANSTFNVLSSILTDRERMQSPSQINFGDLMRRAVMNTDAIERSDQCELIMKILKESDAVARKQKESEKKDLQTTIDKLRQSKNKKTEEMKMPMVSAKVGGVSAAGKAFTVVHAATLDSKPQVLRKLAAAVNSRATKRNKQLVW